MKRVHFVISGDVQGVGYRAWMWQEARNLGLMGWVMNRDDGTVEAVAEGDEEKLKQLIELCHKGPEVAWVKNVHVLWEDYTNEFFTFEIR